MFPFDMSPLSNVPACYVAFERGSHANLAVQPAITLQQATGTLQQATDILRPKLQTPDAGQAYREKTCTEHLAKHTKKCASVKTYPEPGTLGQISQAQGYISFGGAKGLIRVA